MVASMNEAYTCSPCLEAGRELSWFSGFPQKWITVADLPLNYTRFPVAQSFILAKVRF